MTLRQRLLLGASLVTATTLTTVVVLTDVTFRANIREDLEGDLAFAVRVAQGVRAQQMRDRIAEAVQTAMDTRLRAAVETGDPPTVRQALAEVVPLDRAGWSAVVDPGGDVLAATPGAPVAMLRESSDLIDEAFYFDTGDLWIQEGVLFEVAASAILFGSTPLGILVTGVPLDGRALTAMEAAVGRSVVAAVHESLVLGDQAATLSPGARSAVPVDVAVDEGIRSLWLDGEQFLAASLPLRSSRGQVIGGLTILDSLDRALQPSRALRTGLLVILLLGLGGAMAASRVFFRAITVPVNRLVRETRRLASGELDHAIHPIRNDEIGELAQAFEAMRVSLRDARDDLIRAERLGAIGQAASAVAHDFAQPLSIISGSVSMLEMDALDPGRRRACFDKVQHQLARIERMRREMTDFARGGAALELTRIPVDGFLDQIASGLQGDLAARGTELTVSHGYVGTFAVDPDRLGRVIENLVRNAAAALGKGGNVAIRTGGGDDALLIEVEDDGPGIPEEILGRVFEPFVSHGKKDGTGLGLAIAANVVEQHGGTIDVRSGHRGTCFTICLPGETPVQADDAGRLQEVGA